MLAALRQGCTSRLGPYGVFLSPVRRSLASRSGAMEKPMLPGTKDTHRRGAVSATLACVGHKSRTAEIYDRAVHLPQPTRQRGRCRQPLKSPG
jgi:hypothetical protein